MIRICSLHGITKYYGVMGVGILDVESWRIITKNQSSQGFFSWCVHRDDCILLSTQTCLITTFQWTLHMVSMGVHRAYRKILSSNEYLRIAQNGCHVAGDIFKPILVLFRFKFPWNMHPIISKLWLVSIMTWGWKDKKQWSGPRMAYFANSYIGHLASMSKILVWTTPYRCFDWYMAMRVKCIVIIKCDLFVSCLVFICLFYLYWFHSSFDFRSALWEISASAYRSGFLYVFIYPI